MSADYGQAIRVLHHGCEEALRLALGAEDPELMTVLTGAAQGYAWSLQVMTRRPADEHLRSALRRIYGEDVVADPEVIRRLGSWFAAMPQEPPHELHERARA